VTQLSDEALAHLQRRLLEAILLDRPLPGGERAPAFGDRRFLVERPTIAVLDENLARSLTFEGLPRPVRVLDSARLIEEARESGDMPYLRFSQPEKVDGTVRLGLDARIAVGDAERQALGLSGILATFREVDGAWRAEESVSVAT
jgi:hypothetical protein